MSEHWSGNTLEDFTHNTSSNPTIYLHGDGGAWDSDNTEWVSSSLGYDTISTGTGNITLSPEGSVFVQGDLEVSGNIYFDGKLVKTEKEEEFYTPLVEGRFY
jgi:hypothetical protein